MAADYNFVPLGKVAKVRSGYAFKSEDFGTTGCPVIKIKNITPPIVDLTDCEHVPEEVVAKIPNSGRFELGTGDVLIAMTGATVGKVGRFPLTVRRYFLNQRVGKVYLSEPGEADYSFLYYVLSQETFVRQMFGVADGSAQANISGSQIENLEVPLPPLPIQRRIAHILGTLDDKIELNRRMNATLEEMARALFKSWFVDFDPVGAKQAGKQPAGMDAETAALFPDAFEESELGRIPKGWRIKLIEEIADRVAMGPFGSDIKVSSFVQNGIPVISGQHLRGTLLEDSDFNFVSVEHADRLKRSNVQRGDVIFTHAGSLGQVAYIPDTSRFERYIISQRQFYMRCNLSFVSPYYITLYFKAPEGQHRLLANTSSTGVPSISQPVTYLRQLKMLIPPPALLKVFNATIADFHTKLASNVQQSRTLAALRDTLLPKLLSGEISVADAEAEAGKGCAS